MYNNRICLIIAQIDADFFCIRLCEKVILANKMNLPQGLQLLYTF